MLKLGSPKTIGTPVRCPKCRYPNLAIDIWCDRCGTPLDWKGKEAPVEPAPVLRAVANPPRPSPARGEAGPKRRVRRSRPVIALPRLGKPQWLSRTWTMPRLSLLRIAPPRLRMPVIPRIVWVVGLVLAVLLAVPLAYVLLPSGRSVAGGAPVAKRLPQTSGTSGKAGPAQAVAIAAVEAKTGLKYSTKCSATAACLSIAGQTIGKDAATFVFSTAHLGGRECAAYVYQKSGSWHVQDAACALPDQLSPLVGHDASVHVPGNCANVRDAASLQARVVTCLNDGSTVHVDGGPIYADDFMWWHTDRGWMAHDFLVGP